MKVEVQRIVLGAMGLVCVLACLRRQFYSVTLSGERGRPMGTWGSRALLLLLAAFFFWGALNGIR